MTDKLTDAELVEAVAREVLGWDDGITAIRWWLTQSPEELCRLAADFIKSRPDLFP